ncbi:AAA family ATPase [uncultured Parvimonas sp.]|uniref:AAA family ATPase n=1 Tax=uncultured Parvimonas sp. TaxID=747372 RepID=UPI002803D6A6|nr:AAA family ATPase [uncultured Parvimonas sp.]
MIVLNVKIDNLYMFKDFEVNFTFPRKVSNSILKDETLKYAPKIRYKKVNIIMGANASGKTTFGKLLCNFENFLCGGNGNKLINRFYSDKKSNFEIIFTVEDRLFEFILSTEPKNAKNYLISEKIRFIKLNSSFNYRENINLLNSKNFLEKERILNLDTKEVFVSGVINEEFEPNYNTEEDYSKFIYTLKNYFWDNASFYYSFDKDLEEKEKVRNILDVDSIKTVEKYLKVIDDSIVEIRNAKSTGIDNTDEEVEEGFYIKFKNGEKILINKNTSKSVRERLSRGTVEAIYLANFISKIENYKGVIYLDEQMAYMHTKLSNSLILQIIYNLEENSQLFITTHNENSLDLNIPNHSYTFLARNNEGVFVVNPEKYIIKNDRKLKNYVQNDYFDIYPNLDGIWED